MKKAKENWIGEQCSAIEENLKATTVHDRSGKCLTEERQILNRWTEYYSELYNHKANGDPSVLNFPKQTQRMTTPSFTKEWRLQYNH